MSKGIKGQFKIATFWIVYKRPVFWLESLPPWLLVVWFTAVKHPANHPEFEPVLPRQDLGHSDKVPEQCFEKTSNSMLCAHHTRVYQHIASRVPLLMGLDY